LETYLSKSRCNH